jgi:dGTPase
MWSAEWRRERRFSTAIERDDAKSPFQRDVDRILYSSAFRRLAGVTQIVRSGEEDVFHNRLTHSLKVAQVGRRMCMWLTKKEPDLARAYDINCDVVEAACLAHDLGHPPFGHHGEEVLNRLVLAEIKTIEDELDKPSERIPAEPDGFEGNAQTLRIITKLSVLFERDGAADEGLDLTRAVVAGCIKYPWARDAEDEFRSKKWGYYGSEEVDFSWSRDGWDRPTKTLDCQIMDIADDITYSVHDLEDFHRCGVIPWRQIFVDPRGQGERTARGNALIQAALERWRERAGSKLPGDALSQLRKAYSTLCEIISTYDALVEEPYDGRRKHRVQTRQLTSSLVATLVGRLEFYRNGAGDHEIRVGHEEQNMLRLLKGVTIDYILSNAALMAQQQGQGRVLKDLFGDFLRAMVDPASRRYLPRRFEPIEQDYDQRRISARRAACDCICSLTETEAVAIHGRLHGRDGGSVLHPLVR